MRPISCILTVKDWSDSSIKLGPDANLLPRNQMNLPLRLFLPEEGFGQLHTFHPTISIRFSMTLIRSMFFHDKLTAEVILDL